MKKIKQAPDRINFLLQSWMFVAIMLLVSKSLYFRFGFFEIALSSLLVYGFFTVSSHFKSVYTLVFLPSLVVVCGACFSMMPLFLDPFIGMVSQPVLGFLKVCRFLFNEGELVRVSRFMVEHFMGFATKIPYGYDRWMMIFFAILLGFSFFHLCHTKKRLWIGLPLGFFVFQWLRYFDDALGFMNLYIIALITYTLVNQDASKLTISQSALVSRRRILLIYGVGLAVLISVTASLALGLYPLEKVNRAVSKSMPTFFEVRTGYSNPSTRIFSFANTIYKPYGDRLGGAITLNHELVMTVRGNASGLYLRGRVNDIYDGKNWTSSAPSFKVMSRYTEIEPEHALEAYKLEITFKRLETATIFTPYSFYEASISPQKVYQNTDGALYYKKGVLDNKLISYTVKGVPDTEGPFLQQGDSKDLKYRKLPATMPDQVRIMALQATMGAFTARDKMERLVRYLTRNYTYTLEVSDVPEDVDFVHYFLTDTKEGYCTYFASALATMGRSIGVSTRYVEGFVIPREKSANGTFEVTADLAHAWVEAYIEGEGWVVFEATPAYTQSVSAEASSEDASTLDALRPGFNEREEEDIVDQVAGDSEDVAKKVFFTWKQGLVVLLIGVGALISTRIMTIQKALRVQFKGSTIVNARRQYYQIEKIMELIDNTAHRFYTPDLLIHRIFDFMRITSLDKNVVLLIVNETLYSQHTISSTDLEELLKLHAYVDQFARARLGRLKYWFFKYGLNRFTLKKRGYENEFRKSRTS